MPGTNAELCIVDMIQQEDADFDSQDDCKIPVIVFSPPNHAEVNIFNLSSGQNNSSFLPPQKIFFSFQTSTGHLQVCKMFNTLPKLALN